MTPVAAKSETGASLPWLWLAGVFVAALLARGASLAAFRRSTFFENLLVDAAWHDLWAWGWAEGTWDNGGRAFFRAPLYPLFVSLVYKGFGHDLVALRAVQALIGSTTAMGIAACAFRVGGRRALVWAGLIASVYGPLVFFDGEVLIPNLLLACLTWGLCFLLGSPGWTQVLGASACLGLAAIARPNALVLLLPVGWYLAARLPRPRAGRLAAGLALALAPALIVTGINLRTEPGLVFIASQGGANLYAGNHTGASGRSVEIPELGGLGASWVDFVEGTIRVAEADAGRSLRSAEVNRWWTLRALDWMTANPGEALALGLKKLYFLVNAYETPSNRDLYFQAPGPLRALVWSTPVFSFPWGAVFPLAVAGLILLWRKRPLEARLLLGWLLLYGASVAVFFVNARFRMGLVPVLILLAGVALSRWRDLRAPRVWCPALAALLICNTGFFSARVGNLAQEQTKLGTSLISTGRLAEGREVLAKAYADDPSPKHAYLLGQAELLGGNTGEAYKLFSRVLAARTDNPNLLRDMAGSLVQLRAFPEATEALTQALALTGPEAVTFADLGRVREQAGDLAGAAESYRAAIAADPDLDRGYLDLGFLEQSQGRITEAAAAFEAGALRIPGSFNLRFNLALALAELGQTERARAEIDAALTINPLDDGARQVREQLKARP